MAHTQIRHVYDCDPDTFWKEILFDPEFNRRLYVEHLGFDGWEVLSQEENEQELRREVRVQPVTGELPAPLAKLAGDNLAYTERGVFDKRSGRYRVTIVPARLADKLDIRAEIHVEPRGDNRCERFVDLTVSCKVFGVGGLVERRIISDTEQSYQKSFAFGQRHLAELSG